MSSIITCKGIHVCFNNNPILDNINLTVKKGDYLAIIGPNGGGKSTLLKVMLGLITPTSGSCQLFGGAIQTHAHRVGYVPQVHHADLDFPITVFETVLLGLLNSHRLFRRYLPAEIEKANKALNSVEMLDFKDQQIGELSGGQYQRVLIARALLSEPELLLLDEPTASIDKQIQTSIYEILNQLRKTMTIVLVTHDLTAVSRYIDTIACLNHKLHYHGNKEIAQEKIETIYGCHVDLIAHGHPHRVLHDH